MLPEDEPQTPNHAHATAKEIATLKARAALVGVEMHVIEGDRGTLVFVMTKWSLTRQLSTVEEVETFLTRAGARR